MRHIRLCHALLVLCFSFSATALRAADNVPPEGFKALFNGKDLEGWKGLVKSPPERAKLTPERRALVELERLPGINHPRLACLP